jgi:hypothetical protein
MAPPGMALTEPRPFVHTRSSLRRPLQKVCARVAAIPKRPILADLDSSVCCKASPESCRLPVLESGTDGMGQPHYLKRPLKGQDGNSTMRSEGGRRVQ